MSSQPGSDSFEDICVLNDVYIFDIPTGHWLRPPSESPTSESLVPQARYAHLSSITSNRLFIIGGQDINNTWVDVVCIYDLARRDWIECRDYPRHCGTYRSVAVSSNATVRLPQEERQTPPASSAPPVQGLESRFDPSFDLESTPSDSLIHLPYSAPPTKEYPSDIYMYSNYNVSLLSLEYSTH